MKETISFYVGTTEFCVSPNSLSKNGEVIAEGESFIFQLLLGEPAYVIMQENAFTPPIYIKTGNVTAVLPGYEYFDGVQETQKFYYHVHYLLNSREHTFSCIAADEANALNLLRQKHPTAKVIYTRNLEMEREGVSS